MATTSQTEYVVTSYNRRSEHYYSFRVDEDELDGFCDHVEESPDWDTPDVSVLNAASSWNTGTELG